MGMEWAETELVELAVLGTLLTGNAPAPEIVRLLRPDDFTENWRGDAIAWLQARRRDPLLLDADASVPSWAQPDTTRFTRLFDAAGPPAYLPEYVRLLVEASTARAVAGMGVVLHAGALSASTSGDAEMLGYAVRSVRAMIGESRERLARLWSPDTLQGVPEHILSTGAGFMAMRLSSDRFVQKASQQDPAVVAEAERRFIAALINHPKQALYWTSAIGPVSIVSRPWRAVYEAVQRLARGVRPIDRVTVAVEIRKYSLTCGSGPQREELQRWVEGGVVDDPAYWGRQVATHRLRRAGAGVAESLREAAANPGLPVDDLLDTAEILTVGLANAALLVERTAGPAPRRLPGPQPPGASPSPPAVGAG